MVFIKLSSCQVHHGESAMKVKCRLERHAFAHPWRLPRRPLMSHWHSPESHGHLLLHVASPTFCSLQAPSSMLLWGWVWWGLLVLQCPVSWSSFDRSLWHACKLYLLGSQLRMSNVLISHERCYPTVDRSSCHVQLARTKCTDAHNIALCSPWQSVPKLDS